MIGKLVVTLQLRNIKQDAYELDNFNEHGAEFPALDGALDE
jgi:hypothetical protein